MLNLHMLTLRPGDSGRVRGCDGDAVCGLCLTCTCLPSDQVTVAEFTAAMEMRSAAFGAAPLDPQGSQAHVAPGAWFLAGTDAKHHRTHRRRPK
jgi:hypothetical protein